MVSNQSNFTPADLAMFARFRIPLELIYEAGVERVSNEDAREYGVTGSGDLSGLAFHHFDPVSKNRITTSIRRDHPPIGIGGRPEAKYLLPHGDSRCAYILSADHDQLLSDHTTTIVFVEAEKSKLALTALFRRRGLNLVAIAVGGCWAWIDGRAGKHGTASGERVPEKGVIRGVGLASNGRRAIVLFDSNMKSNPQARAGRNRFIEQLKRQGADVWAANLPVGDNVNGPDDYLAACGDDAMVDVIDAAQPDGRGPAGKGKGKETQSEALLRLADVAEFFHDDDHAPYAAIPVNGHRENWPVESRNFSDWLRSRYYEETNAAPQSQALSDALNTLSARAQFGGERHPLYLRVAGSRAEGKIYLDLVNQAWEVVEIDAQGWRLLPESPVRFRRSRGMHALPTPIAGGQIEDLRQFLNIKEEDDWNLVISWLLAALRPQGPYPILIWNGEQGNCKSTGSKVVRALTDPNKAGLRAAPKDERDLFVEANGSWIIALDNLSHLPDWLSDALCRLATGGGLSTRQLYTDLDETIIDATRPIILNGIAELATRGDLLDRAVIISLSELSEEKRRDEDEFWQSFNEARPAIFGAILDVLARSLRHLPHVKLSRKPRMADFALFGSAVEVALGWDAGTFMKAYEGNRLGANSSVIDAHPVGVAIQAFVARGRSFEWGTAKDFLEELCIDADQKLLKQRQWPGTPQGLGNALHRLAPSLRRAGLDVEFSRKKDSTRTRILRVAKISSEGTGRISLTAPLDNAPKETSSTRPLKTNSLDIMDISDGFFAEFRGDSEEGSPQPNGRRVEGRI